MVASSSITDPAALACESMVAMNVTAEGYPGARYHAGCKHIDEIESLAIDRAKRVFGAQFANVQCMSASSANEVVMFAVLQPGDTLMGLELDCGGHLTHGSRVSLSGQVFNAIGYGLTEDGGIDYEGALRCAREHRPKLIICGTTAYPRRIDFARFREIADDVGAYLLADITHIAGLVAAGLHPSPIDHAHFTTTCTHKQLYGGRGGLILIGRDHDTTLAGRKRTLAGAIQKTVFPFFQGAPNQSAIASKARGLAFVGSEEFRAVAQRVVALSQSLASGLAERGYRVVTGGTDNHIVVVELAREGLTGVIGEKALEDCNIIVNKNRIPGDQRPPQITSGLRLGTNGLAIREMTPADMADCVALIDQVLRAVGPIDARRYRLDESLAQQTREAVREICVRRPIGTYPTPESGE